MPTTKLAKLLDALRDQREVIQRDYYGWYEGQLRPQLVDIQQRMQSGHCKPADQDIYAEELARVLKASLYEPMLECVRVAESVPEMDGVSKALNSFAEQGDRIDPLREVSPEEVAVSKTIRTLDKDSDTTSAQTTSTTAQPTPSGGNS